MKCYLCNATKFIKRKGQVRDNPDLKILECLSCGLVALNSHDHVRAGHYENSGMHENQNQIMELWFSETVEDDQHYSLSNHLYWVSRGQPGGHKEWESLNSPDLNDEYAKALAKIGKSDTVIGIFEKDN